MGGSKRWNRWLSAVDRVALSAWNTQEQKKDQTEEINQLKEQLDREKKEQLNEIEKLKNELEKEKNKGFFARLFGK